MQGRGQFNLTIVLFSPLVEGESDKGSCTISHRDGEGVDRAKLYAVYVGSIRAKT